MDADQPQAAIPASAQISRRILVADDNRDVAETLAALLEIDGHQVTLVHDGASAIDVFALILPEIVLLDIGMPGLNGYDVARRIRQSHPDSA